MTTIILLAQILLHLLCNLHVIHRLYTQIFKECDMAIYQVLDEQNHPVFETLSFITALQEAELLNHSFDDHYFFVEKAEAQQH